MSALAHWLEEEGIATTLVALVRLHAEKMAPPRSLWVPFELGRPFGAPNAPDFQRRVLRSALEQLARQRETSVDTLAYAFLLRHPSRMHPITGSGRLERIAAAVQASELELSREEWFDLWRASTGAPLP